MRFSPKQLAMGAIGVLVVVSIVMALMRASFSVIVLSDIAAIAFMTVVAVMIIGSQHGFSPVAVDDSPATNIWIERAAQSQQAASTEVVASEDS